MIYKFERLRVFIDSSFVVAVEWQWACPHRRQFQHTIKGLFTPFVVALLAFLSHSCWYQFIPVYKWICYNYQLHDDVRDDAIEYCICYLGSTGSPSTGMPSRRRSPRTFTLYCIINRSSIPQCLKRSSSGGRIGIGHISSNFDVPHEAHFGI